MRVFVGYDPREALAYHLFCESVIRHASRPVSFHPLHKGILSGFDGQQDGTNAFIYSRYLVPYLCDFTGRALFFDGDMVVTKDIAELWDMGGGFNTAVSVVKHDYKTKHARKYVGTRMESDNIDYPRKNWSSVMLWNCSHYGNRALTPEFVSTAGAKMLHRFEWLKDEQIGELPSGWNHLVGEYPPAAPALYHYTLGVPGIKHYQDDYGSWHWHTTLLNAMSCGGESAPDVVARAVMRVGEVSYAVC